MRNFIDTPAKINLFLEVTRRWEDGYHELRTLFWPLPGLCDRVEIDFNAGPGLRVDCGTAPLPADADNLAGRAALEFAKAAQLDPDWRITVTKNIPIAAGLGGGSSDAAAVLRLLNSRYQALDGAALRRIALSLGADVPFFLAPSPALAGGVGEQLEPLHAPPKLPPLLVIAPDFPVSARWAYTHLAPEHLGRRPGVDRLIAALRAGDAATAGTELYNALGFALFDKFPLLRLIRERARRAGASGVEITGSGPTLFALAPDPAVTGRIAAELRKEFTGLRLFEFF